MSIVYLLYCAWFNHTWLDAGRLKSCYSNAQPSRLPVHYKRHSKTDVVGWTDAGIGTDGEVGLGWMILERAWPHGVVAMGHVYQSAEEAQDGKDSSREELKALTWAHWHMRQIRMGNRVEDLKPLPPTERKKLQTKILVALQGSAIPRGREFAKCGMGQRC